MTTYKELLKQREELEAQIHAARKSELSQAIAKARALISEYELTVDDIFNKHSNNRSPSIGQKIAPKYRDEKSGLTWTGRGKPPKWIKDQNRDLFAIPETA